MHPKSVRALLALTALTAPAVAFAQDGDEIEVFPPGSMIVHQPDNNGDGVVVPVKTKRDDL